MKSFAANFARIGLVARVDSEMGVQSAASVEGFVANVAPVRFFARVDYFVSAQRRGLSESFATNFTNKWAST